jgi:hypothetical protein
MGRSAIHPGEHLAEQLEELGMSAAELSRQLKVPTNRITEILNGQRSITGSYDGVVVPGALVLLVSGSWMIVQFFGGWNFVNVPWLAGMVALFAFEFVEGNTVTRLYFLRLRRLTQDALLVGAITPELEKARAEHVPTFTHFLDLPMLFVIIALGTLRPTTWTVFFLGSGVAIAVAATLTALVPHLYPWRSGIAASPNLAVERDAP